MKEEIEKVKEIIAAIEFVHNTPHEKAVLPGLTIDLHKLAHDMDVLLNGQETQ